jgi:hypothetical protein
MSKNGSGGGVAIRVILALLTLVAVGIVVVFLVRSTQQKQQVHHRKALQISEFGLLEALQKLQENPSWRAGFPRTGYSDGWYAVDLTVVEEGDNDTLVVKSTGHSGPVSRYQISQLTLSLIQGDSIWVQRSLRQE